LHVVLGSLALPSFLILIPEREVNTELLYKMLVFHSILRAMLGEDSPRRSLHSNTYLVFTISRLRIMPSKPIPQCNARPCMPMLIPVVLFPRTCPQSLNHALRFSSFFCFRFSLNCFSSAFETFFPLRSAFRLLPS